MSKEISDCLARLIERLTPMEAMGLFDVVARIETLIWDYHEAALVDLCQLEQYEPPEPDPQLEIDFDDLF